MTSRVLASPYSAFQIIRLRRNSGLSSISSPNSRFYADKQEVNNSRILKLDKTVNVDNTFEQFKGLLEKEVIIELEDGSWRGIAKINFRNVGA
jgi:hypothetical protein